MPTCHSRRRRTIAGGLLIGLAAGLLANAPPVSAEVEAGRLAFPQGLSGVAVDGDDGRVFVQEFVGPAKVHIIDGGVITATVVLPGGPGRLAYDDVRNRIYVTEQSEGRVLAIDADTATIVGNVSVGAGSTPVGIEVDPVSGRVFVAKNTTGQLAVLDGPTLSPIATVAAGSGAIYLVPATGGDTVYVSNQNNTVTVHEAPSYNVTATLGIAAANEMALDEAAGKLYVTSQNEGVVVYDTATNTRLGSVWVGSRILHAALIDGGATLVAAVTDAGYLSIIDTATLTEVGVVGNVPTPVFLAVDPANDHVYSAGGSGAGALVEVGPSTPPSQLPEVSVAEASVVEADPVAGGGFGGGGFGGGGGQTSFPNPVLITLDQPSTEWVKVTYSFGAPGTAQNGSDYSAYTSQAFIAPGESSVEVPFYVTADQIFEPDETATFSVVSVLGGVVGPQPTATITIIDDDEFDTPPPVVALAGDVTIDENGGPAVVDLSLDGPASTNVTVYWQATAGTASLTADYSPEFGALTIPAGQVVSSFDVAIVNDAIAELDEGFTVALTFVQGDATFDPTPINISIVDDDTPVLTLGADVTVTEGNGPGATANVAVVLNRVATAPVVVTYATTAGTADASDYTAGSGSVTIAAGASTATIATPIVGDTTDEFNEFLTIDVTAASGAVLGDDVSARVNITDDDAVPTVSISDASASEGDPLTFTLTLSSPSGKATRVNWATATQTANTADYVTASGVVNFPVGATTATVVVAGREDTTVEPNETMRVLLSSPSQLTVADGTGVGTIVNDDVPPAVTVTGRSIAEGNTGTRNLQFTVSLSAASTQSVSVTVRTVVGTATSTGAQADFQALTQTVTFAAGQTTKLVPVVVVGDRRVEANETFRLTVQTITGGATGVGAFGTGTITNDD